MNIFDRLTLFFLTLSAVKSAHIPRETERGRSAVISILEVYARSFCKPRELTVDVLKEYPVDLEYILLPSCVVLTRCAGCCNDERLQCVPTSSHNITMEIKRVKPLRQQNTIFMSFAEHSSCECRFKNRPGRENEKKSRKGKGKGQKRKRKKNRDKTIHDAACKPCCNHCSKRSQRFFVQDPVTCRCSCKYSMAYCEERQLELNERTCKCGNPR